MDHLENRQLFEMLAGQVQQEQHEERLKHIAECSQCRSRWLELQATWGVLGQWDFQTSEYDFTTSILEKIPPSTAVRFFRLSSLLRIAASILIGLYVGHLAGRMPSLGGISSQQAIVRTMHLETLTLNSATGFGEPLLESDSASNGVEP